MRKSTAILAAALLAVGCSRGASNDAPTRSLGGPVPIEVSAPSVAQAPQPPAAASVSARVETDPPAASQTGQVRTVLVTVTTQNAPASQNVEVEFESPTSGAYERQVGTIADSNLAAQTTTFKLPVAGTFIDTGSLVGTWRAHVFVDGVERTLSSFELTP